MHLLDVGEGAVLAGLAHLDDVLALHAALTHSRARGEAPAVEDLVPAERTLLVRFDRKTTTSHAVRAWLAGAGRVRPAAEGSDPSGGTHGVGDEAVVEVPVRYDGEDLDEVGRLTGLGVHGVIAAHTGTPWRVAFTGFAPGFGYLVGGDERLQVPRLATPRVRVPAGAVALAGSYSGVYPQDSPGGWRLIGTTRVAVWDLERDPPALLRPGARVLFQAEDDR